MDDDIQLPSFRTVRMTLIDTDQVHCSEQKVKVFVSSLGISISAEGYSTADRMTVPIVVTQDKGELILIVFADINTDRPTHVIRLGHAKEIHRRRAATGTR